MNIQELQIKWFWIILLATHQTRGFTAIVGAVIANIDYKITLMNNNKAKCAEAQMLIRKPVEEVFEAFINPSITKNFWFTKGSGRLEVDKKITWEWEMYNVSTTVIAREILPNQRILFEWGSPAKAVEFNFKELDDDSTFVTVTESGYDKTGDELIAAIKDSTGGFTTVLDGLKAFLEHRINLNLIADKFPKEVTQHA